MPVLKIRDSNNKVVFEDDGGCYGFLGRLDEWDAFDSYAWKGIDECSSKPEDHQFCITPTGKDGGVAFESEALKYLTWLLEESPYESAFLCTAEQAIQQGYVQFDPNCCNQTLILGLSHLRRSDEFMHRVFNTLPDSYPGGFKHLMYTILKEMQYSSRLDLRLGANEGDSTSTVMRSFDAEAMKSWLDNKPLSISRDSYIEAGGYETGFCEAYEDDHGYSTNGLQHHLSSIKIPGAFKTTNVKGLFAEFSVAECDTEWTDVAAVVWDAVQDFINKQ